jgi:hypothetical protein
MESEKVEIYFKDFTEEKQAEILLAARVQDPKELNWDAFPIHILEFEDEE